MTTFEWIHTPVAGKLDEVSLAKLLEDLGDTAIEIDVARPRSLFGFVGNSETKRPWQNTSHAFGYIPNLDNVDQYVPIQYAGKIAADETLKGAKIKITLGHLRVAEYPGSGIHNILFDFYAQNQIENNIEHLHFNNYFRVMQGQQAPVIGYPIFIGLNVGNEGIALRCYTINVNNENDEKFLSFLESDVFKSGLKLVQTLQPAIAPFSKMALSLTQEVAKRNKNIPVQDFYMGLDFSNNGFVAHLREGSYIAVQIPDDFVNTWSWDNWIFDTNSGQILDAPTKQAMIPYNYIVFNISRVK